MLRLESYPRHPVGAEVDPSCQRLTELRSKGQYWVVKVYRGKKFATAFLNDWIRWAKASGVHMFSQMGKRLDAHCFGLLANYDYPISTGPLEGTNNRIKSM